MSGIKIINVLRDDSLGEIMELFRQAPTGEVIFVLPRTSKVFSKEDHFTAFAAEALGSGKTVTLMTSSEPMTTLARKYKFTVMPAGKTVRRPSEAVLASVPLPGDDEVADVNSDAFQDDVPMTSDETMDVEGQNARGLDENDEMEGFHVEDNKGNVIDADEDGQPDRPAMKDAQYGELTATDTRPVIAQFAATGGARRATIGRTPRPAAEDLDVPIRHDEVPISQAPVQTPSPAPASADLDYIDAVWRDKVAQAPVLDQQPTPITDSWLARIRKPSLPSSRMPGPKTVILSLLGIAVIALCAVLYFTAGKASVTVAPMAKPLEYQLPIQAADSFSSVDAAFGKIPGQEIEVSKTATVTIAATGQRDVASKARGKITVYNEYSSTPQTLVATTRFATPDGKVFRTLQNISVPGSTLQAGKQVAGTITVDVIADKPGPDYNIAAGKFIVLAFQEKGDTERVQKFYGVSDQVMSGGASGPSSVVTEADYAKALDQATSQVRSQMKDAIAAQGADLVVLQVDNPPLSDPTSTAQPEDAAKEVSVTISSTLKTVAFRKADLESIIRETLLRKERQVVLPERLDVKTKDISYKADTGVLAFSVTLTGTSYAPLDTAQIARDIAGKDAEMVRTYFRGRSDVGSATVDLSPFWVSNVPVDTDRISVQLVFDESVPK